MNSKNSRSCLSHPLLPAFVLGGVLSSALSTTTDAFASSSQEAKVEALLNKMTLEEKIGQMTQADMNAVKNKADIAKYAFGSMLSGGDSDPADLSPLGWRGACQEFQAWALKSRLQIPLIYGVDAVHGHNNVDGAVIFPHNIGLGATRNAALVQKASQITAREVAGTGIHWAFAPCVAAAQNPRWGRTYESFSEDPDLAGCLGAASVRGLETALPKGNYVLSCPKHFAGDGGTTNGIDQGNTICDEATFRKLHVAPYIPAIKAGALSIMVSYSSWNGQKMHGNKYLLTDVLKGELGFKGFIVSDWAAIDQLSPDYKAAIEQSINAGVDMAMIPNGPGQKNSYVDYITFLKQLVQEGRVTQARVDDAVRRILRAKFQMKVFEEPFADPKLTAKVGSPEHREVARQCVRESLVVLKNQGGVLPLSSTTRRLVVAGTAADDLGTQCGGWTITWQGKTGKVTSGGTTILAGLRQVAGPQAQVTFSPDASNLRAADTVLVVIGEPPYAEMKGDRTDLNLAPDQLSLVHRAKQSGARVVTILLSGRPMILGSALEESDALIAAWLPGTEGQGVADVLLGKAKPTGKLPRTWPRTNDQLGVTMRTANAQPLFSIGFGLTW